MNLFSIIKKILYFPINLLYGFSNQIITKPTYYIQDYIKNQKVKQLAKIETKYIYEFINDENNYFLIIQSIDNDKFIIDLYNNLNKNWNTKEDINYNIMIISKLITTYLFFYSKNNSKSIVFLSNNKELFDYNLWLKLLLSPNYGNDSVQINKSIFLAQISILPINKPIKYCNLELTIFEYILLGKRINVNNTHTITERFFDKKSVIIMINKMKYYNAFSNKVIKLLKNIYKCSFYDKDYVNTILLLI